MSYHGYYGGYGRGPPPHDRNSNNPPDVPRSSGVNPDHHQSHPALYRGHSGPIPSLFASASGYGVDPVSSQQPQVIDYESKRLDSNPPEVHYDRGQGDYRASSSAFRNLGSPSPTITSTGPAHNSFAGALSKISLDDLKNTLGGQLGNLLSKGLAQQEQAVDGTSEVKGRYDQSEQQYPDSYAASSADKGYRADARYSDNRSERDFKESSESGRYDSRRMEDRSYTRHSDDYYSSRGGTSRYSGSFTSLSPNDVTTNSTSQNAERRTLFPIASSSEEKPRSILKKSILKKNESVKDEPLSYNRPANDVVDEDDFLYGGVGEDVKSSKKPLIEQTPDTKPDTQKIIANPAFTALLKQIGLDDINMAERIKERQGEQQTAQNQRTARTRMSSETEQGFGIDQTASFLSSGGVLLDDLLKLKQPLSNQKDDSAKDSRHEKEETNYKSDNREKLSRRTVEIRRSDRDSRPDRDDSRSDRGKDDGGDTKIDRRNRNDKDVGRSMDKVSSKDSSRKRSRSPDGRKRSPTSRRRSRSPNSRRRSPVSKRRSRTPDKKARSRSPDKRGRNGRDHSPNRKDHAERQPNDRNSKHRDSLDLEKALFIPKPSRWATLPAEGLLPPPISKPDARAISPRTESKRSVSVEQDRESLSRKRVTENIKLDSPPSKFTKRDSEALQDLMSKIPGNMKLTRSQFEELLAVHKARREPSPTASSSSVRSSRHRSRSPDVKETLLSVKDWAKSNLYVPKEELFDRGSLSTFSRHVGQDKAEDDFKNLKMVIRNDGPASRTSKITDDDLLDIKPSVKTESPAPAVKREAEDDFDSSRRVVRRIGAMGSATLEKHVLDSDKEKYLKEFEQNEWQKAFGNSPLIPKLSRQEVTNIRQIIEFNKEKLAKAEKQLLMLQESQSEVMKNLRNATVGEQYHLDKTIGQNIRLQNEITAEIKDVKKLVRDDELTLGEQFEQERKIREIQRKKVMAAKAVEKSQSVKATVPKEESPPPEKQDRKYRRAIEDRLMGKNAKDSSAGASSAATEVKALGMSQAGTVTVEYYDPGTHWCKCCDFVAFKLIGYLEHLQTSSHMKRRDKIGKPWQPDEVQNPPRKSLISRQETAVQPMKGVEFIHPVDSFYCKLCNFFTGDKESVEFHLKTDEHHKQYEVHITDNPMYEKRFRLDKEAGLVEAKKLEGKRKEEQERQRDAAREEEDRHHELQRRREREKREDDEKRKLEKAQKLIAKKKAAVLAITRGGDSDDSDVEVTGEYVENTLIDKPETPQEKIKRELLQKMRAKKAVIAEEPGVMNMESALSKAGRLALEARKAQDKVKAKAAEIEQAVYGPKLPGETEDTRPGIFLPLESTIASPKTKKTGAGVIPMPSTVSYSNLPTYPEKRPTAAAPPTVLVSSASASPSTAISPFVQKMMEMEKTGEIITTASVKAASAVRPQIQPQQQPMLQPQITNYGSNFGSGQMGPVGPMMGQMGPPGTWNNNQMMAPQMNTMPMAQSPMMGPPGQMMGMPGQMMNPMMGPPNQMMGSPNQMMGPPNQMMGPPNQMMGPPNQMMGPPNQMMGPPNQMMGPPNQMMGPPNQMMGPPNQMMGPPTQIINHGGMNTGNTWIPPIQTIHRKGGTQANTFKPAVSSLLSDVSPPGTTPVPLPPSTTEKTGEESSSSSGSDSDSEDNTNNAGHSFSLSGLLSQFSTENGNMTSTPAVGASSSTKPLASYPKPASVTSIFINPAPAISSSTPNPCAVSSTEVKVSAAVDTTSSPSTAVQAASSSKYATESSKVLLEPSSMSEKSPAREVQLADSTVQSTESSLGEDVASTVTDEALTVAETEEQAVTDSENIDDMTFTVIDSVGEDDDKS